MKKILLNLFLVIATVELLLILLLEQVVTDATFFWLPILLDSLLISIAAILAVSYFIKKGLFSIYQHGNAAWIQVQIGLIVFL